MVRETSRLPGPRRGFTLLEMLVVVALVVLMMTVLVSIFQATTGAMSVARANQELDQRLRMLDGTIRRDLGGATATFTPPLDPKDNLGYFEYGENALSDAQGEDTDDYLRFTAKAPEGQPFTGRLALYGVPNPANGVRPLNQYLVSSEFAEITYFLRDGNLYRRVLLVAPQLRGTLTFGTLTFGPLSAGCAYANIGGSPTGTGSWQGMNDISARPTFFVPANAGSPANPIPTPNTLGDLTSRENRYASPRFCDDYTGINSQGPPDGVSDDNNLDGVPDYYPTLFPNAFAPYAGNFNSGLPQVNYPGPKPGILQNLDALAFPYLFPGMYSTPPPGVSVPPGTGRLHSLDPTGVTFNHAPLEVGDSLPVPTAAAQYQTWWGFPTWKETLCAPPANSAPPPMLWADPVWQMNQSGGAQAPGLSIVKAPVLPLTPSTAPFTIPNFATRLLDLSSYASAKGFPDVAWQDDLLMTGVRSFDVKAYDPNVIGVGLGGLQVIGSGYVDLGYLNLVTGFSSPAAAAIGLQGFGHEGRIPPLKVSGGVGDYRFNPQLPSWDVGDLGPVAGGLDTVRLRRVYDTWSTTYTNAPMVAWGLLTPGQVFGGGPLYPSYPAPYPIPLRGIQIQIRVVDPSSEHVRVLTIRQDFSDKI